MTQVQFLSRSASSFASQWPLICAVLGASVAADPIRLADVGTRVRAGISGTSNLVRIEGEVSNARVLEALQTLARYLANPTNQGLNSEDKRLLYANLWDLYD
jgi:hypothetical protein